MIVLINTLIAFALKNEFNYRIHYRAPPSQQQIESQIEIPLGAQ